MYDVIVIGSGISGACIARELSKYRLDVLILEKEFDVAYGATLANSAIVHAGHDPQPNTNKAKFNIIGNRMYEEMSKELDIPYVKCGGHVVATNKEEVEMLNVLYNRGLDNGLMPEEMKLLSREELFEMEPNISDQVIASLYLPTTAITYPLEAAVANIENAMDNGVKLKTNSEVIDIKFQNHFIVHTKDAMYESKILINAAGVNGAKISNMITQNSFDILPRRGEYFVIDKDIFIVNSVIYPTPSKKGKGVLITPQYHGNTLIGPSSEYVDFIDSEKTSYKGLNYIKENANKTIKNIPYHKVIRSFAGSRPHSTTDDFIIEDVDNIGFINVVGIESPGLTAAPAIAKYVVEKLVNKHLTMLPKDNYNPFRKKVVRVLELTQEEKQKLYQVDHRYANIICRCEMISEGEIVDAINRNCGARSITGVKNRVRAGAGRCQGGFCQPEVLKILARELQMKPEDINYSKKNSQIFSCKTKGE